MCVSSRPRHVYFTVFANIRRARLLNFTLRAFTPPCLSNPPVSISLICFLAIWMYELRFFWIYIAYTDMRCLLKMLRFPTPMASHYLLRMLSEVSVGDFDFFIYKLFLLNYDNEGVCPHCGMCLFYVPRCTSYRTYVTFYPDFPIISFYCRYRV